MELVEPSQRAPTRCDHLDALHELAVELRHRVTSWVSSERTRSVISPTASRSRRARENDRLSAPDMNRAIPADDPACPNTSERSSGLLASRGRRLSPRQAWSISTRSLASPRRDADPPSPPSNPHLIQLAITDRLRQRVRQQAAPQPVAAKLNRPLRLRKDRVKVVLRVHALAGGLLRGTLREDAAHAARFPNTLSRGLERAARPEDLATTPTPAGKSAGSGPVDGGFNKPHTGS
jgi:hypothetical protein